MYQVFMIEEERLEVEVTVMRTCADPIDVSSFGDSWRQLISSGLTQIELQGMTKDGRKINGTFRIISRTSDGTICLKSHNDGFAEIGG